ncbi:MAG: sulfatase-like hydrolase/transferase [Oligoflexia bacterium]|nr:sulfatase-like hydrolase/transferase [Oligoflexia bacterium]
MSKLFSYPRHSQDASSPSAKLMCLQRWYFDLLFIGLCTVSLGVLAPFLAYIGNQDEFAFGFGALLQAILPWSFITAAILLFMILILPGAVRPFFTAGLLLVVILSHIQSTIFAWDYGVLDGSPINWSEFVSEGRVDLALWLLGALVCMYWARRLDSKRLLLVCLVCALQILVAISGLGAARGADRPVVTARDVSDYFKVSSNGGTYILLLDAFYSPIFETLLKREPDLAERFSGFTFYRQATSDFTSTVLSIPAIMTGKPFDSSERLEQYFDDTFRQTSLVPKLTSYGIDARLASMPQFCRFLQSSRCLPLASLLENDAGGGSRREAATLMNFTLFRLVPQVLKERYVLGVSGPFNVINPPIPFSSSPRSSDLQLEIASTIVQNMQAGAELRTFRFAHLLLPHQPIRVDRECGPVRARKAINAAAYEAQSRCAIKLALAIVRKLKELQAFDNSLVIVMADHGVNLQYGIFDPQFAQNNDLLNHSKVLPLLLVKPPRSNGPFSVSDAPVKLSDLTPSVLEYFGLPVPEGMQSLFSVQQAEVRPRIVRDIPLRWRSWRRGSASRDFAERNVYQVIGDPRVQQNWRHVRPTK